ncbi:RDD family protein [Bacteroidia bacterium]|nr:RDD family protein [Bacteroidia bacterium]GHV30791.1 RDD family protein [Bacteroidia bacterium]
METIDVITSQHVTIKYQAATVVERLAALLLDFFFAGIYFFAVSYTLFEIADITNTLDNKTLYITILILFWLPAFAYHFLFESMLGGRTPGKMILKIKVTNIDGSTPGIGAYFLRWILMIIDFYLISPVIGAAFIVFSSYHQRIGDLAAGTIVIKNNQSVMLDLDNSYYDFPDNYQPTFINVERLSEGQAVFIMKLLIEPKQSNAVENSVTGLANKVKTILNINPPMEDRRFLETVLRDYNYYASLGI